MIFHVQNRLRNTWLCLKPSVSIALSRALNENLCTVATSLAETLESSQPVEPGSTSPAGWSGRSDFDAVVAGIGVRGSEDDVFCRLSYDKTCDNVKLSGGLVQKLLHKFRDDWKSALGFFKWAESRDGYKHSTDAYDAMVDILGKAKKWDQMEELVEKMRGENLVTLSTIAKIMRRYAGARRWEDAVRVFDELRKFGLEKNTESMNLLLDTLCKEKRVEQARRIFFELKSHIPPNAHTFSIFIHGWCTVKHIDEAHWTLQEMKGYGCHPCVVSYSTIIRGYCKEPNYGKVYEILDEMDAHGCPPNAVTYTTIMSSLLMQGQFEEALLVPERMKKAGCKPDAQFYNCLIHALARAGWVKEAVRVFRVEMPQVGVPANTSTYNSMIAMFCHHDQEQEAFEVLKEMESSELCNPDHHTYHSLLKSCFKKEDLAGMSRLLDDMVNKHHLSLDESTYTLLIHNLCGAKRCEWAYRLFEEMISQDLTPRFRTCRLLLKELNQKNMYKAADRVVDFMKNVLTSASK